MFPVVAIILIATLFGGCSSVYAKRVATPEKSEISLDSENTLLLLAMDYQMKGMIVQSAEAMLLLFEKTHKPEYATEYLKNLNEIGGFEKVISEFYRLNLSNDNSLNELAIAYYLTNQIEKTKETLLKIETKNSKYYAFWSVVYSKEGNFSTAINYSFKAYQLSKTANNLIKLTKLYILNGETQKAIDILESEKDVVGLNNEIWNILNSTYVFKNQYEKSLEISKELYEKNRNPKAGISIVQAYKNLNQFEKMVEFLEKSQFDNSLLLDIYIIKKKYKKGLKLAEQLKNDEPQNPLYTLKYLFIQMEVLENQKELLSLIEQMWNAIKDLELQEASYLNYVGYLMIENNYKISEGVELIKKALLIEPENMYILDSLAFGEFKLKNYKDAYNHISKVIEVLGTTEPEILEHWKQIKLYKEEK